MGTLRKGKPGLKRYLLSKIRQVKEILRKEIETPNPDLDEATRPPGGHLTMSIVEPPQEPPPDLPELPPLPVPEPSDVLRVDQPTGLPKTFTDKDGRKQVRWTDKPMQKVRKILEICTWTMMISNMAIESNPDKWKVCTPVSIEHGFNVLTPQGRKAGEEYIKKEKPDLIVGEWMCGPFSSLQ